MPKSSYISYAGKTERTYLHDRVKAEIAKLNPVLDEKLIKFLKDPKVSIFDKASKLKINLSKH